MKTSNLEKVQQSRPALLIAILILFYCVGTIGILLPKYNAYFLSLSFFNLLLSFIVILLARKNQFFYFFLFLVFCFIIGISVEVIGTKTGLLFGNYQYGQNLGFKLMGVPFVIGINWGILVVSSASIINKIRANWLWKVVLSSMLMTFLDILMEPVAMESDFWHWKNGVIPFYNYVCWFLVALPLHFIYFKFKLVESNKVYDALFIILIVFFSILNIF
jgi:putative membrane protein